MQKSYLYDELRYRRYKREICDILTRFAIATVLYSVLILTYLVATNQLYV